jgi:hypothetical protein
VFRLDIVPLNIFNKSRIFTNKQINE